MLEDILGQPDGILYLRRIVEGSFKIPLLLVGEEGTGKRSSVIAAAKNVFQASQHYALERGHHPDFRMVQVEDDKDIKVESIRAVLEDAQALPSWAPWKFIVIDGADRLTAAAANALLKVLEEPPLKVRFFLLSERLEPVIPTIRSRCASVFYRRLPEALLLLKLGQFTEDETKALVCARTAEGSLGRALRCLVSGQLTMRDEMFGILMCASRKDLFPMFAAVNDLTDLHLGLRFLSQILRDIVLLEVAPNKLMNVDAIEMLRRLKAQLGQLVALTLLTDLRELRKRAQSPINLSFHLKSALASACA